MKRVRKRRQSQEKERYKQRKMESRNDEINRIQSEIHELSRKIIENSQGLTYLIDKSSQLNDRITYLETMSELRRHASELEEKIMKYKI